MLEQHGRRLELPEVCGQMESREPVRAGRFHGLRVGPCQLVQTTLAAQGSGLEQIELRGRVGQPLGDPGVPAIAREEDRRHTVGASRGRERRVGLEQPLDLHRVPGRDRLEHPLPARAGHRGAANTAATRSRGSAGVR